MSGSKKMTDVTFVSALFNIDRVDGRKWDEYLKWFDVTLQLQAPMTLFVTEDLVEFVQKRRDGTGKFATHIIASKVEDIPYYDLKDDIQEILDSEEYKKNMADPERIECKQAMYSVIQYSKFRWLIQSLAYNGKECDYFFWLDAGASRFFEGYDLSKEYPSKEAVESLEQMGDSFLVQMNTEYYKDLVNAETLSLDYLYDNRSYVLGSMFGGHKESIVKVHDIVDNLLKNDMIANRNVNNEQIALGYLIKKYPDVFSLYERTNGKHMDLFQELG